MNAVPHYHKFCSRVSHIWGNRRGQHIRSAMDKPRPGKTTFVIMVSPLPGKYELLCPPPREPSRSPPFTPEVTFLRPPRHPRRLSAPRPKLAHRENNFGGVCVAGRGTRRRGRSTTGSLCAPAHLNTTHPHIPCSPCPPLPAPHPHPTIVTFPAQ